MVEADPPLPKAYELGEWDFYNITLKITPDVLIPRPDTEHLVDLALSYLRQTGGAAKNTRRYMLDLCCGSGCIGLAVAANHPNVHVTYADISEPALAVARMNGAMDTVLLNALNPPQREKLRLPYDLLLCNPPYVAEEDVHLEASVRSYEPHIALFGGKDGLDFYRSLLPDWLSLLKPGGLFAVETGFNQACAVSRMAINAGLRGVRIIKDYAGHDRVVHGHI